MHPVFLQSVLVIDVANAKQILNFHLFFKFPLFSLTLFLHQFVQRINFILFYFFLGHGEAVWWNTSEGEEKFIIKCNENIFTHSQDCLAVDGCPNKTFQAPLTGTVQQDFQKVHSCLINMLQLQELHSKRSTLFLVSTMLLLNKKVYCRDVSLLSLFKIKYVFNLRDIWLSLLF